MSFYCLCEAKNNKPDSQHFGAPNRYAALRSLDTDDFPPLALDRPMRCIKQGARQVLLAVHKANDWSDTERPKYAREHYPNVDVFECPNCHARMARE